LVKHSVLAFKMIRPYRIVFGSQIDFNVNLPEYNIV